ncbi:Transmembrane protein 97 [Podochytrium sp. JEL0797]|nr:Transmembrane protein 97 [Podochytrium sp. JEL0797]
MGAHRPVHEIPRRRPLTSRPGDLAMILFFALHIPITLLMGTQLALPDWTRANFPSSIVQAADDYARDTKDFLVIQKPIWFVSTVWCELFVQLPFFVFLIYSLCVDSRRLRTAGIVYATHTCTCLVPILAELVGREGTGQTREQWVQSVVVYSVWFFVPVVILVAMIFRKEGEEKVKKA